MKSSRHFLACLIHDGLNRYRSLAYNRASRSIIDAAKEAFLVHYNPINYADYLLTLIYLEAIM